MTDLEITKLCAEAMGWLPSEWSKASPGLTASEIAIRKYKNRGFERFDPIHEDAQAMALVKKFELCIDTMANRDLGWCVSGAGDNLEDRTIATDLNRAICECVAKMQAAKVAA